MFRSGSVPIMPVDERGTSISFSPQQWLALPGGPRTWNSFRRLREEMTRWLGKLSSFNFLSFQGELLGNISHMSRNLVHPTHIQLVRFYLQDLSLHLSQISLQQKVWSLLVVWEWCVSDTVFPLLSTSNFESVLPLKSIDLLKTENFGA